MVDLTPRVEAAVKRSGIKEGIAFVSSEHTTGALILNEYEELLLEDLKTLLRRLAPSDGDYMHRENGFAHLRSMLLSPDKTIPVHAGRLGLGRWQSLYWVEMDKLSRRRIIEATVIGE